MKAYKGTLSTKSIQAADVIKDAAGYPWNYTEAQAEQIAAYMRAWDGIKGTFIEDVEEGRYCLIGWDPDDDLKVKEAIWLMEQDPVFGNYHDDREQFDIDWGEPVSDPKIPKDSTWEPSGAIVFDAANIENLIELKGGNNDKTAEEEAEES